MDWKLILRIAAIASLVYLLLSSVAGCRNKVEPIIDWDDCSQQVGDHPCDFTLIDQNGDEFKLYDHHGKVIILDFSTMWCGPCMMAAQEIEHLQQKYGDKIFKFTFSRQACAVSAPGLTVNSPQLLKMTGRSGRL